MDACKLVARPPAVPSTSQVALQSADYAAWNLWAAMNGRPLLPFRYQHLGNLMSLGAANAAVALPISLPQTVTSTLEVRAVRACAHPGSKWRMLRAPWGHSPGGNVGSRALPGACGRRIHALHACPSPFSPPLLCCPP